MFSLIISIIAIALVAALALASIYYGGSAFQEGSADAEASTVVNQGQQIQAAWTMADVAEETLAVSLAPLTASDFLKEVPTVRGESWVAQEITTSNGVANTVVVEVENAEICSAIEERFNGDTALSTVKTDQAFGCMANGEGDVDSSGETGSHLAFYRL